MTTHLFAGFLVNDLAKFVELIELLVLINLITWQRLKASRSQAVRLHMSDMSICLSRSVNTASPEGNIYLHLSMNCKIFVVKGQGLF